MTTRMTLVLPEGDATESIALEAPLDHAGRFDTTVADEWPAIRHVDAQMVLPGSLRHDPEDGWSLRFAETAGDPDAPLVRLLPGEAPVMLGGYLSIREPDGRVRAWQVVSLG